MASPTRSRAVRALRGASYVRLWSYMSKQDQVYAMCFFAKMHEDRARVLRRGETLVERTRDTLGTLGLPGRTLAGILGALQAIRPSDVLGCENALRRGPTDDPGLVR